MGYIRKSYLLLLLAGIMISQATAQQQQHIPWPSLADSPWPVLRGDMQGTGRSRYVGPRTKNVVWRKDMPLGVLYGPVTGYDDVLYMGERALSPDSVNYFYAVDKNGHDLWTYETRTFLPNNGGPIIAKDSTIYFASANQNLYALKNIGVLKWRAAGVSANFWPFHPISQNGDIYLGIGDTLVIISPMGTIKDKSFIPELIPGMVFSTGGDTMFYKTGGIFEEPGAINASDLEGNLYWSYNFAFHNWGIPLVDNHNKIYVFGSDSTNPNNRFLYRFNPDGSVDWRYQVSLFLDYSAPTIDKNGNIIFNARKIINSEERNCIISLDYNGNENWIMPFEGDWDDHYINHGLVCDAEGKIYCGSSSKGNFYCIDSSGVILWTLDLGEYEYDSCPAIGSDGTLYIGTHISSLFQNHRQNLIAIRDDPNSVEDPHTTVLTYSLEQNYPNPFNSSTTIHFQLPRRNRITLTIYDVTGREVIRLVDNRSYARGEHKIKWEGKNQTGNEVSTGIYLYQLRAEAFKQVKKMLFIK